MELDKTVGKERKVVCLECDSETYHTVLKSVNEKDENEGGVFWLEHEIIMCQGCRVVSFRKESGIDEVIYEDSDGNLVYNVDIDLYPSRIKGRKKLTYVHHLPYNVRRIYEETHKAISGNQSILAAIGIRALVEAVCAEKKAEGNDLRKKIDNLVEIGILTKEGAEILHKTRIHGNEAAHEASPIQDETLTVLIEIAENLLKNTYILPKQVASLD